MSLIITYKSLNIPSRPHHHNLMVPVDINDFNGFLSSTTQVQNTQLDKNP